MSLVFFFFLLNSYWRNWYCCVMLFFGFLLLIFGASKVALRLSITPKACNYVSLVKSGGAALPDNMQIEWVEFLVVYW